MKKEPKNAGEEYLAYRDLQSRYDDELPMQPKEWEQRLTIWKWEKLRWFCMSMGPYYQTTHEVEAAYSEFCLLEIQRLIESSEGEAKQEYQLWMDDTLKMRQWYADRRAVR